MYRFLILLVFCVVVVDDDDDDDDDCFSFCFGFASNINPTKRVSMIKMTNEK